MTRAPFRTARPARKHNVVPHNPELVEAYFLFPLEGAHELALRTGMTPSEVIEGLNQRGLPMGTVFEREANRE